MASTTSLMTGSSSPIYHDNHIYDTTTHLTAPAYPDTYPHSSPILEDIHSTSPIISSSAIGLIHVRAYTHPDTSRGIPITARIDFYSENLSSAQVRLVVDDVAVQTKVSLLPNTTTGRWHIEAFPPPDRLSSTAPMKITVQALANSSILDSVTFGEFVSSGMEHSSESPKIYQSPRLSGVTRSPSLRISTSPLVTRSRASSTNVPAESPTSSDHSTSIHSRPHRRGKSRLLKRAKSAVDSVDLLNAQTPILDLVTPLETMCHSWTLAERRSGRRLVRFHKIHAGGRKIILSCEAISQEQYNELDTVISCIHRQDNGCCYITSVDIIYLLEHLTDDDFPVEEKNRIRRNLEGLRPTTVSKHKAGYEIFFQTIMNFPDPKPRNIEKDLKVFEWALLGQALDKILSKYLIAPSPTLSVESLPRELSDTPPLLEMTTMGCSPSDSPLQLAHPGPASHDNILFTSYFDYPTSSPFDTSSHPFAPHTPDMCDTREFDTSRESWISGIGADSDIVHSVERVDTGYPSDYHLHSTFQF